MTPFSPADAALKSDEPHGPVSGYGSKGYRTYVLNALLLIYILNFLDRGLLGIVSEPLMNDLKITDGQFGLLTGIGFALLVAGADPFDEGQWDCGAALPPVTATSAATPRAGECDPRR